MLHIKDSVNPIGTVIQHIQIDNFVAAMQKLWDETKQTAAWWKVWANTNMVPVTNFLLSCLDELILIANQAIAGSGADKKATVLAAIGRIYDYIIVGSLPLYLRPFAGQVRNYIVYVLVSAAIDWIVTKYNNGSWQANPAKTNLFGVPGGHRPV